MTYKIEHKVDAGTELQIGDLSAFCAIDECTVEIHYYFPAIKVYEIKILPEKFENAQDALNDRGPLKEYTVKVIYNMQTETN